jgi:hypothetical protein
VPLAKAAAAVGAPECVSSLSLVCFQGNVRRVARKMMRTSTSRPTVSSPRPGQPFEAPVATGTTIKLRCATARLRPARIVTDGHENVPAWRIGRRPTAPG